MLNVPFVTHLIHHHRLPKSLPQLAYRFRAFVEVNPLYTTVGNPWTLKIVEVHTVVNRPEMMIRVFFAQNSRIPLPVLQRLLRHQIILICQRPPDVAVCAEPGNDVVVIQGISLLTHTRKSPSVVRVHDDQVSLYPQSLQLFNAAVNMLEILRTKPCKIPVVPF